VDSVSRRTQLLDAATGEGDDQRGLFFPLRAGAFWAAVALPFVQLSLLATDLGTAVGADVIVALLLANAFALLVGHSYRR
jgi:hypothetical protein